MAAPGSDVEGPDVGGPGGAPRGRQRRVALVEAAAGLLSEGGPEAVTARATARAAGLPLAAVSYHVEDVATLVREGADLLLDRLEEQVRRRVERPAPGAAHDPAGRLLAAALVDLVLGSYAGRGPDGVRALYARTLELSDDPALAGRLRRFDAACAEGVRALLAAAGRRTDAARAVLALVDGWLVAALVAGGSGSGTGTAGAGDDGDRTDLAGWAAERLAPGLVALAPPTHP
ncbi:hypothetical protein WDZ17_05995 [Pseudokineococcus basanitobsidens]|uniref:HTH tetR-type domain-containing protein n=1 Tax=Pseudokineococcus basanitobsidens TaxID=1926649 RepID=A0ABU8RID8_9ACTN